MRKTREEFFRGWQLNADRKIGGKNHRSRSSALIDGILKIDLPPDTFHHVLTQNLDMTQIENLLFTHGHDDHFAIRELQYMSWMFLPEPLTKELEIAGPRTTLDRIRNECDLRDLPLTLTCLNPWETAEFGRWQITPILATHDPEQICFNYLIHDGKKTLLYATDTGWYSDAAWEFLGRWKIDAAVIECTKGKVEGGYDGHLGMAEVIKMRSKLIELGTLLPKSPVVTTHHSHIGGLLHNELEAGLNPHGIEVGFDGKRCKI